MKLSKVIKFYFNLSNKDAEKFIKNHSITINGENQKNTKFDVDIYADQIIVDLEEIKYEEKSYYMLNKAENTECSNKSISKTVFDDLIVPNKDSLFSIGRLDKDTTGLLIITNDGDLCHYITSPKNLISKVYLVHVDKALDNKEILILINDGIILDGSVSKARSLLKISSFDYELEITEGKFHQVKRMFEYFGCKVLKLKRIRIGKLYLDKELKPGQYRKISKAEIEDLCNR